ncbi:DbpA RNA binding domain protein [anaerobic digester metagenome]
MTREELIQRFVSVEFNRFLNYYKDIPDLDNATPQKKDLEKKNCSFVTFRLNLGSSIGLTKRDLMRYINQLQVTRGIEIGQINIFGDYSIIDLDARYQNELLQAFGKIKYKGIAVEASLGKPAKNTYGNKDDWKARKKSRNFEDHVDFDTTYHGRNIWEGSGKKANGKSRDKGGKPFTPQKSKRTKKSS